MENIKERLEDTVRKCVSCYENWTKDPKDTAIRQQLDEAVLELRKVTSRIEIEMAIADRSNSNMKPMPIPPHRAAQGKPGRNSRKNNNAQKQDGQDQSQHSAQDAKKSEKKTINLDDHKNTSDDKPKKASAGRSKLKTASAKTNDE